MPVAVVIATRNRRESLLHTLDRLAELPDDVETIVVDNRSSDGTPAAVARRHPGVRVLSAGRNRGAAARTLGARATDAETVAFSDDDSWWAPGALTCAAGLLDRHRRVGLVAARVLVEPEGRLDPTCTAMAHSPLPVDSALPGPRILGFVACGTVVRRTAFLDCDGFEERLGVGGEETLLAIDMAAVGWELVYVDDVVAHHMPAPSSERASRDRRVLRNRLWIEWLRRPRASAARGTVRLVAGTDRSAWPGVGAALRGLPWILRERRPVGRELDAWIERLEAATAVE